MNRSIITILCWLLCSAGIGQTIVVNTPFPFHLLPTNFQKRFSESKMPAIIEVFSSHCTEGFTILPALEKQRLRYEGRLQFYLIAKKDPFIKKTYEIFKDYYSLGFPIVIDSVFPAKLRSPYLPLFFWIDAGGTVQSITGPAEITADNINRFLDRRGIVQANIIPQNHPVGFLKDLKNDSSMIVHAEFTKWKAGDPISIPMALPRSSYYFQALGIPANQLIQFAYTGKVVRLPDDSLYGKLFPTPILNKASDSLFDLSEKYNYQIGFSNPQEARPLQETIKAALLRALEIEVRTEYRLMPYWSLTALNGDTTLIATKYTENAGYVNHGEIKITNCSLPILINLMQRYYVLEPPIIDETGMKGNVDINIQTVLGDREALKAALFKNGFELAEKRKLMQVVVIYSGKGSVAVK
jgi:hypothetical protein